MDIPLPEVLSAGSAVVATSIAFSRLFFTRIAHLENILSKSIQKLNGTVAELDKRLAVNSCIIDRFLEEGCHGTKRNKASHKCD
jgi:hypothetical protein